MTNPTPLGQWDEPTGSTCTFLVRHTGHPAVERVKELERENARLRGWLKQAETIIDVQKKVSELLGIPLRSPDSEGND